MKKLPAIVMCTGLIIAASGTAMASDGADTYKLVCSSCHESGIDNTPKLEDKLEWKHRMTKGMDALYASVQNGQCEVLKDLRRDLSDEAIKAAVDYMVSQAKQPSPFD
jgi:cytochrome c5